MILWNKFFHCCCKQSALFSGLLVIIQHHPVKLYHIALAFAVLCQQTHSVNPSSQQLCPHKRTFSHIAGISLLQFLLQSGLTLCQARFVHSLSGNAAEKFPPAGGMGDWGFPQQARLSYKCYACANAATGGVGISKVPIILLMRKSAMKCGRWRMRYRLTSPIRGSGCVFAPWERLCAVAA